MKIHPTLVVLNDILLPKVRVTLTFSVMKMNVFYFSLSCGFKKNTFSKPIFFFNFRRKCKFFNKDLLSYLKTTFENYAYALRYMHSLNIYIYIYEHLSLSNIWKHYDKQMFSFSHLATHMEMNIHGLCPTQ